MTAARRKPTVPATPWDMGQQTPAQRYMQDEEEASYTDPETGKKVNPNGVRRRRRIDWVERYQKRGLLTKRQMDAGHALIGAWEATMRTPPAIKQINVDVSPKPDAHIQIIIDRQSRYIAIMRAVPKAAMPFVRHVVIDNRPLRSMQGRTGASTELRYLRRLGAGLDAIADGLGI